MQAIRESRETVSLTPWLVCFSAALFFFYEFIQGNMFASISQEVMRAFHIGVIRNGWLSSIYYLSNVIFLFPAGIVLDRYSTKKVILVAMTLCVFGTFLFAVAENYYVALLCRFLTGIGSAFCFLSCVRLASRWFPAKRMALVTGLIVTMAMFGGMVAQAPLTLLVEHLGWRHALAYDGLLGLLIIMIVYSVVQDSPEEEFASEQAPVNRVPFFKTLKNVYGNSQNIFAAVYTSLMNMPVAILGAYIGSIYLVQTHHYLRSEAANINGMIFLGTIIGGPLLGFISDKLARRRAPMILCTVLSMVTVVAILYLPHVSVLSMELLFFALGFFTSAQIISYPLVAENNPLNITATAVGVVSVLTQGGFLLYQNLFSFVLAHAEKSTGNALVHSPEAYQSSLLLIPYGFVIALLAAVLLNETYGRRVENR